LGNHRHLSTPVLHDHIFNFLAHFWSSHFHGPSMTGGCLQWILYPI
jgi:hypothetical protein